MFRPMRRSAQALGVDACREVLSRGTSGVLALLGDGGWPYAVPMSYAFDGEKLYFHCAREGHKLDAIRREARASFCVVDRDDVKPAEYTSYFRSVIIFGRVRVLEDKAQKRAAIEREWAGLCMLEMDIEHMSGKEAKELAREGGSKQ